MSYKKVRKNRKQKQTSKQVETNDGIAFSIVEEPTKKEKLEATVNRVYKIALAISGFDSSNAPELNIVPMVHVNCALMGSYNPKRHTVDVYLYEFLHGRRTIDIAALSNTLAHELRHAIQCQEVGCYKQFDMRYNFESAMRGYTDNKYEVDARDAGETLGPKIVEQYNN